MEQRSYIVRCSCGEPIPVQAGDAGRSVPCVCGQPVEVPALSVLRSRVLPEDEVDEEGDDSEVITRRSARRSWVVVVIGYSVSIALFAAFVVGVPVHLSGRSLTISCGPWLLLDSRFDPYNGGQFLVSLLVMVGVYVFEGVVSGVIGFAVAKVFDGVLNLLRPLTACD